MKALRHLPWLLVPMVCVGLLMGKNEAAKVGSEDWIDAFELEQARLDLPMLEARLEALQGLITEEEAQGRIDRWMRENEQAFAAQIAHFQEWMRQLPPPPEPSSRHHPHFDGLPQAARYGELEAAEAAAMRQFRERAADEQELQALVAAWAEEGEGKALLDEKISLWREAAALRPLGSQPIVIEVPEDAGPAALATLDFQENIARRLQAIRHQHPEATELEMQGLIDEQKEAFEADIAAIGRLLKQEEQERLEREVAELRDLFKK